MLNITVSLLAIAATVLEVVDVLSTYHMLARGGHEENPIVAWFMQVLGDAWPLCKLPEVAVTSCCGRSRRGRLLLFALAS